MTKIKGLMSVFISIAIVVLIVINYETILNRLDDIFSPTRDIVIPDSNEYVKEDKYLRLEQVDDYIPYDYEDLINIFYSALNQGWKEFTFYCPQNYVDCLNDVASISTDETLLTDINNYVHPYNSYSTINTYYDNTGKITLNINYLYTEDEIKKIDDAIDMIISDVYDENASTEKNIKYIHDYIIDNTKYDKVKEETDESKYDSSRMNGLLFEGYAVCSAYSDVMAVVLTKLNVPNFKISSENHVWNAVYIDGEWLHLDLTWDDPVSNDGEDMLDYSYFLIDTSTLLDLDKKENEHVFDTTFYLEFNN